MHHHLPLLIHVIEDYKHFIRELDIRELDILGRRQLVVEVVEPKTVEDEDRIALAARPVREQLGNEEGPFDTAFIP